MTLELLVGHLRVYRDALQVQQQQQQRHGHMGSTWVATKECVKNKVTQNIPRETPREHWKRASLHRVGGQREPAGNKRTWSGHATGDSITVWVCTSGQGVTHFQCKCFCVYASLSLCVSVLYACIRVYAQGRCHGGSNAAAAAAMAPNAAVQQTTHSSARLLRRTLSRQWLCATHKQTDAHADTHIHAHSHTRALSIK